MELKEYQQGVLRKIDHYLAVLSEKRSDAEEFVAFQKSRGKEAVLADFCRDAWDHLNNERVLPYLRDKDGNIVVAPYPGG